MAGITSIDPNSISTAEMHKILLAAVSPRPIAFASTISSNGAVNLSPFSFFNVFSANPPILIFSPARRTKDNTIKHTLENIRETKEVVINTVNFPMVEQMSLSSTEYDKGVNEFKKSGLISVPSIKVKPPRVSESPVSFECIVDDIIALGNQGGAGNLIISRIVYIHINDKYLGENGEISTQKLDLVARMGGNWYTRVTEESLFEIPKPILAKGIGVDKLPKHIFKTNVLSGNNIGRLGNIEKIPTREEINQFKNTPELIKVLRDSEYQKKLMTIHIIAKNHIENNNLDLAIKAVFAME